MPASDQKSTMTLIYEGSVKQLFASNRSKNNLLFHFTDDYSVFDWGKMPDAIKKKGRSLTISGAYFFEIFSKPQYWQNLKTSTNLQQFDPTFLDELFNSSSFRELEKNGISHHYVGLSDGESTFHLENKQKISDSSELYLEVQKAEIFAPKKKTIGRVNELYFYPGSIRKEASKSLIPLEVVFRFGMPQGSSLKGRLNNNPLYFKELGLDKQPEENELFNRPVIEFFTKLEPTDRHLSWQEAVLISCLDEEEFEALLNLTYSIAIALFDHFTKLGITLFDGKFEFLYDQSESSPKIMLADSIGPDELRLIYKGHHLSKELIRQYYQDNQSDWTEALKQAKKLSHLDPSVDFKERCINELSQTPKQIEDKEKLVIDKLYPVLTNTITGNNYFDNLGSLNDLAEELNQVFQVKPTEKVEDRKQ